MVTNRKVLPKDVIGFALHTDVNGYRHINLSIRFSQTVHDVSFLTSKFIAIDFPFKKAGNSN